MRRILSILAVAAMTGRPVGVDELAEAVYGDAPPARVRRSLFTEIWRCRQLLGGTEAIIGDPDGYRLDPDRVDVDVVDFVRLLGTGRQALDQGELPVADESLAAALVLWRGDPIPDWQDHPDGRAFVARLTELQLGGTEDHAEVLAALGRHHEAIGLLEGVTRDHPVREHAWALLIDSQLAVGNRRRARAALDVARRTLAEHGVDLGAELRAARDLLNVAATAADAPRATTSTPDRRLLGRGGELDVIIESGARALRSATPTAVLIAGEAGIGKTALVDRAAQELAVIDGARTTVERMACDRRLNLPYGTLRPVLSRLAAPEPDGRPDVDAVLADATDAPAVVAALAELLEEAADRLGGLVLVVEDVHWATREVLDVLLAVLARRTAVPLVLLATVREPGGDAGERAASALAELRRRATPVVVLGGLTAEKSRELLGPDVSPPLAAAAYELTGGNPLYLEHLRAMDGGQRPASLTDALDDHVDSLPIDVLPVLELAATIGTAFDTRVLTAAAGAGPAQTPPQAVAHALQVARAAGLVRTVRDEATQLEFVHALLRDRLYERAPATDRITAHALVARALGRLTGLDAPTPDLVAHHSFAGWPSCPTVDAVAALTAAGDEAGRQLAFGEALGFFRQALDLIAMDARYEAPDQIASLLAAAGQAAAAAADLEAARRAYAALRAHGERSGELEWVLRGSVGLLQTYANDRVDETALDELATALEAVATDVPTARKPDRALVAEGVAVLTTYRPPIARDLRRRIADRDPEGEAGLLARVWEQESVPQQAKILARLTELEGTDRLSNAMRRWATELMTGRRRLDDPPPEWAPGDGAEPERWEAVLWQITMAIATGQFDRADRLLATADGVAGRARTPLEHAARAASLLGQRTWLAYLRADVGRLAELLASNPPNWTVRRPIQRVMSTFSAAVLLPPDDAWQLCDTIVDEFLDGAAPGRHQLAPVIALSNGCIGLGHRRGIELCRDLLRPAIGQHATYWVVQYWGCADYHLARLAAAAGDYDEAVELFDWSVGIYRKTGARCFEAMATRGAATVRYFRDRGNDRPAAESLNERSRGLGADIGMPHLAGSVWPPIGPLDLRPHVPLVLGDERSEEDDEEVA